MSGLVTANGVPITDGLRVWTNDLRAGVVDLSTLDADGWFYVREDTGGRTLMSADRVTTRHPFTGATP